jgi:formate hydrogenlyase subunit 6/NADH:ubiquinone oxidoreductase subunit I
MSVDLEQEVGTGAARPAKRRRLPGAGLLKGLGITLKHMLQPSITQQYPDEKPNLPPRTRGVIALKEANCTVCYKCSRECPDWCIYIDAHKETHPPASGGRARSVKVLDRFAIDYALCMYCGICVEVCPFDALFWAPDFEYAEYDILEMTHEKERLEEWTYKVLPPPQLEDGAEPLPSPEEVPVQTGGGVAVASRPPSAAETPAPGAQPPAEMAPARAEPETPTPPPRPAAAAAEAPATAAAAPATEAPAAEAPAAARPAVASAGEAHEVEPDQETLDRVLAEELAKGTDRRVAEGRARAAGIRAARRKAEGG